MPETLVSTVDIFPVQYTKHSFVAASAQVYSGNAANDYFEQLILAQFVPFDYAVAPVADEFGSFPLTL